MTGYAATRRLVSAFVLAALMVLAVAPAAIAGPASDQLSGWERTSNSGKTQSAGGDSVATGTQVAPVQGLRGWEATGTATGNSPRIAGDGQPVSSPQAPSFSPTLLYVLAALAAIGVAFGTARMLRPHGRSRVA